MRVYFFFLLHCISSAIFCFIMNLTTTWLEDKSQVMNRKKAQLRTEGLSWANLLNAWDLLKSAQCDSTFCFWVFHYHPHHITKIGSSELRGIFYDCYDLSEALLPIYVAYKVSKIFSVYWAPIIISIISSSFSSVYSFCLTIPITTIIIIVVNITIISSSEWGGFIER